MLAVISIFSVHQPPIFTPSPHSGANEADYSTFTETPGTDRPKGHKKSSESRTAKSSGGSPVRKVKTKCVVPPVAYFDCKEEKHSYKEERHSYEEEKPDCKEEKHF